MPPKLLLHGSGAIGTIYLYLLQKAGYDITAVCRSNYDAVKSNGFLIDSVIYGEHLRFHPKVARSPAEAAEANPDGFDYIIVTTKALPDSKTAEVIRPAVTPSRTCIVLIQNGIGIEDEYADAFPNNPILSCVVYLPTTQVSHGHIEMGNVEALQVGAFPASAYTDASKPHLKTSADAFMGMLRKAGSNAKWYADVQEKRWNKLLLNAPWNPMCALTLSRDVALLAATPEAETAVEEVMLEVAAIAANLGYESISAQTATDQLKRAKERIGGKGIEPSMLVDVLWDRRMEVETILGNPVKVAKRLGVPVPRLEMLYVLAKALDEAVALREKGKSLAGDEARAVREKEQRSGASL